MYGLLGMGEVVVVGTADVLVGSTRTGVEGKAVHSMLENSGGREREGGRDSVGGVLVGGWG